MRQTKIISVEQAAEMRPRVESTAERMGESAICLNIFTEDYGKDIPSLIQFALCLLLDKPLFLLAPEGRKIPESVKKVASGIEFFVPNDNASMQAATHRLLAKAQQKGFSA